MVRYKLIIVFTFLIFICSCSPSYEGSVVILTWNVNNLFDDRLNHTEYSEYVPGSGWNTSTMLAKVRSLQTALATLDGSIDVLCLQEVETDIVTNLLRCSSLQGYPYQVFFKNHDQAVGLAVISRFPIIKQNQCQIIHPKQALRSIQKVRIALSSEDELLIYNNHWKSALGHIQDNKTYRLLSADLLLEDSRQEKEATIVIAVGDLNEDSSGAAYQLLESGNFFEEPPGRLGIGSYYYHKEWEWIDHIFVSKQFNRKTEIVEYRIVNEQPFSDWRGYPSPSDHFPVLIKINAGLQK
ncbi:endonuclease/exonuclease/phosphatase family protein [Spirochaeta cellobiosiphila]|uniref:endonuclease/exonuclease/phosphatase family protein n=1 Tax=Spirochaeta cellobiosiphila TaxID=504483 RepID=UPI00048EC770|nr:endonuclease/exonuclease/phosphatase family protein [Spirochaeta cellobiosiphila]